MSLYLPYPNIADIPPSSGYFLAVGRDGKVATSPDGFDWTLIATSFTNLLQKAIGANGLSFITSQVNPRLEKSEDDSQTWTNITASLVPSPPGFNNLCPAFAFGNYCFGMTAGNYYKSVDGAIFSQVPTGIVSSTTVNVAYGDSDYLVFGYSTRSLIFSIDGGNVFTPATITPFSTSTGSAFINLIRTDNYFIACALNTSGSGRNVIARSSDLITWASVYVSGNSIDDLEFANGVTIAFSEGAGLLRSIDDFTSFTVIPPPGAWGRVSSIASDKQNTFVVCGENISVSNDGGLSFVYANNNPFDDGTGSQNIFDVTYIAAP